MDDQYYTTPSNSLPLMFPPNFYISFKYVSLTFDLCIIKIDVLLSFLFYAKKINTLLSIVLKTKPVIKSLRVLNYWFID